MDRASRTLRWTLAGVAAGAVVGVFTAPYGWDSVWPLFVRNLYHTAEPAIGAGVAGFIAAKLADRYWPRR